VCCTRNNVPADRHFFESDNGLAQEWGGLVWCNPPYGRAIPDWIAKSAAAAAGGAQVLVLIPARTGARWWHEAIAAGATPLFLRGRLKFWRNGVEGDAAPFDSAILCFGLRQDQFDALSAASM
ncbi:adenine methyltransferase, partial [Acidithiobacillus ferridurans]|uniref:phage N-6-adenine-methyltransferase n=1 Tax=Acidithiobacillus ferridurans TaxID=1232575 RepID=UPI001C074E87